MALSPTGADLLLPQLPEVGEELNKTPDALELEESCLSPAYSPLSVTSTDSGVLAGFAEDTFLASLFGDDCPLLSTNTHTTTLPLDEPLGTIDINQPSPEAFEEHYQPRSGLGRRQSRRVKAEVKVPQDHMDRNQKNAEMARQHRQKKKQYVETLERDRVTLKTENVLLKTKTDELRAHVRKLENEVQYLKSVLANQSTLAALIRNIPNTPGVRLSTSFESSRKRPHEGSESDVATRLKRSRREPSTGGVCLHVSKDAVSLEFCPVCSKQAAQS